MISTERQQRFEPTGQARTSIRQQSHQHLFHKQETPFFEPDTPVGAVKVQQFAPRQRIGLSHSPEFLPLTAKKEETKEKAKEISIVKVDQSKVDTQAHSPTGKDFAVKIAARQSFKEVVVKHDHFVNEMKSKPSEFAAEFMKDNGRSTTFQAPKNFREQLRKKMEEEKLVMMAEATEKEWQQQKTSQGVQGDQLSLKEKRLAEINKAFAVKDKQKSSKGRPGESGQEQSLLKQMLPDLAMF